MARELDVRRVVLLSGFGVTRDSSEPALVARARAEELLMSSGLPYLVFRSSFVVGAGDEFGETIKTDARFGSVQIPGDGTYQIQPIIVDDCARVLIAAAMSEDAASGVHDLLGSTVDFRTFVEATIHGLVPRPLLSFVSCEEILREATFSAQPWLTASELAILTADRVGEPTVSKHGVRIRSHQEFARELFEGYFGRPSF